MTSRWHLLMVLLAAALPRFVALDFGMPMTSSLYIRPDESLIAASAVRIFEGAGRPGTFAYPAFFMEVSAAVYHAGFSAAKLAGALPFSRVGEHFGNDPSPYFLILRWMAAICGVVTAGFVWAIARRLAPPGPALAAGMLYALSPLAIRDAHFGVTDTPYVMLTTAMIYYCLRLLDAPALRDYWLATACLILAVATKYAAVLAAPVWLAVVWRRFSWKLIALGVCLGAAMFFAANPYLLILHERAWREITMILRILYGWQPGDPEWTLAAALGQILRPLRYGPGGWPGLALACAALFVARREPRLLAAAAGLVSTSLVLLPFQHTVPYRYLLPALPSIALLAAIALDRLAGRRRFIVALGLAGLLAEPVYTSALMLQRLSLPDTRSLAGDWIRQNIPVRVPIVWAGGPECEPHFLETPASIQRRIDFAFNRYGSFSGEIVSQPYFLMKTAAEKRPAEGYEVYRNPKPQEVPDGDIVLVTPDYPLAMARFVSPVPSGLRVVKEVQFPSLDGPPGDFELDRIDAFFLPWRPLSRVIRPGPGLTLRWLSRGAGPSNSVP